MICSTTSATTFWATARSSRCWPDDIADIMVNGANAFIEVAGKIQLDQHPLPRQCAQLMNICQRIVSQVGRRVDEASPICDARLPTASRVNVIVPPLAIDGPRSPSEIPQGQADALTAGQFGSISPAANCSRSSGASLQHLISGGTGSGKTTLLNRLTAFIETDERVITCEDAAELSCSSRTWCA